MGGTLTDEDLCGLIYWWRHSQGNNKQA